MPTVEGFFPVLLFGLLGGVIAETIRVAEMLKRGVKLDRGKLAGSALYALLGGGVFFFGWNGKRQMLETAILGAAFPSLFASMVRAKEAERGPRDPQKPLAGASAKKVSFRHYMASRV